MGESRTDLLNWLNDLLQVNYTKIEQCGTGGAYCQILDSIYGDVPMTRVKMNARHEYEFIANYKVMQNVMKAKKIEKPVPVEKLVKCKMQDNLEFLQWMKKFWDANYAGTPYDPVARRRNAPTDTPATIAPLSTGARSTSSAGALNTHGTGGTRAGGRTPVGGPRTTSAQSNETINALRAEISNLTSSLEGLEKERDFYFAKLRDIEILIQQKLDLDGDGPEKDNQILKDIQLILYTTEEGFEVPAEATPEVETF